MKDNSFLRLVEENSYPLMAIPHVVDREPGAMSRRAQTYMQAAGMRHFWIGLFLAAFPWLFSSGTFIPIFNLAPFDAWAVVMIATGITCCVGAICRNGGIARAGIVASAAITLVLAAGLCIGITVVWYNWINTIGWHAFVTLVLDRPDLIPASLLLQAPAPPSPFLPIILLAVTVKDFAVCAQPLRVPLEDMIGDNGRIKEA